MSDTSLVFNLVARDQTEQGLSSARERFDQVATGIGASVGAALGVGVAASIDMEAANAKLAAQLGLGPQEAADVSKVAASVYSNAWGDSIDTVNSAIKGVYNNIGDVSQVEGGLEGVTSKALALSETFDQEVGPTTAAVGQLIRTGLAKDATEAFDILTAGFQTSANKADDFLDTINEYSVQFKRVGLDGQTAVGLIDQAIDAGAKDSDQVADALGQFGELAVAQSTSVQAAFKSIGVDSDVVATKLKQGGKSGQEALQMTLDALRGTTDQTTRLNAATALFGDPGTVMGDALLALNPAAAAAASGMDQAAGSTDKLMKTAGGSAASALETFKRKALVQLTEVTGGFVQFAMDNQAVFEPLAYVFAGLAATVLVVRAAMVTYSAVSTVVSAAHTVMASSTWTVIGGWLRMNAVGLAAYARIAAGAVVSAATTAAAWTGSALVSIGTWVLAVIRAGAVAALQFALMAVKAIAWAATMAAQWLIAMGPIGWIILAVAGLVTLIVMYWDQIKAWTIQLWGLIVGALVQARDWMINAFLNFTLIGLLISHWTSIKNTAVSWWTSIVNWVKGVPGKLYNLWLNWSLPGLIVKHWSSIKTGTVTKATEMINWVKSIPGKITSALGNLGHLLWNAGSSVISGFINGLKSKIGSVKSTLQNLTSNLTSWKGPETVDAAILRPAGQLVIGGFQLGIDDQIPALRAQLQNLTADLPAMTTTPPRPAPPLGLGMAPALGTAAAGGTLRLIVDLRGADEGLKRAVRKVVRVDGRGSAQIAFT